MNDERGEQDDRRGERRDDRREDRRAERQDEAAALERRDASSERGWPREAWPVLVRLLLDSERHVILLDDSWRLVRANEVFAGTVLRGRHANKSDFLDLVSTHSVLELRRLAERGDSDRFEVEVELWLDDRSAAVQFVFCRSAAGWVAVGKDRSAQLDLVQKMTALVHELESKVHRERERTEDFRALAEKDPLTGLPNRRYFGRVYGECQRRFETEQRAYSIFCVDVDRFKRVNDEHGHAAGDRVLKEVAAILEGSTRDGDLASRLGGDEFAVIAGGIEGRESVEMAERLRQTIEAHAWTPPPAQLTVSVGVASTRQGDPERSKRLLELADGALYRAKTSGRNRVELAE